MQSVTWYHFVEIEWAIKRFSEQIFKMFWKPTNEQNKSLYFFLKRPVLTSQIW